MRPALRTIFARWLTRFDRTLALVTLTLIGMGLLNLWSALQGRAPWLFSRQLIWLGVGLLLFVGAASFDYRKLYQAGYVVYGAGVALLLAVPLLGRSAGGAKRWLELGPFSLQPVELMKVCLIIALAKHIQDAPSIKERTFRHLLVPLVLVGVPFLLVALQPDLDSALVLVLIFLTLMLTARLSLRTWGGIFLAGVAAAVPVWQWGLRDYQKSRILVFLNPARDAAAAWQPTQAMNAVGSGRLLGKGYLHATQVRARTLPALWTDYPYAVWAEEWGFFGGLIMLVAYAALIFWILHIGRQARDRFGALLCVGCAGMIFWQLLGNVGMATGLLPVAGMTMPLVSYGGSSLLATMLGLGLVMNVSLRRFSY